MKPRIGVATLYTVEVAALQDLTRGSKKDYCERWGYTYLEENRVLDSTRPPAWSKILHLKKHLAAFDWLWWIDVDACVMNPDMPLESLLDSVHEMIVCKARLRDPFGAHNINTGSFFIRNSPWSHTFLERVYAQEPFIEHLCWEQAAICHLYETDPEVRACIRVDLDNARYNSFASDYRKGQFIFHAVEPRRSAGAKGGLLKRILEEDAVIDFPVEPEIRVLLMISEETSEVILQATLGSLVRETFGSRSSPVELLNLRDGDFISLNGHIGVHQLWLQKVAGTLQQNPNQLLLVASDPVQFFTSWERALLVNLEKNDILLSGLPGNPDLRLLFLRNSPELRRWFSDFARTFCELPHAAQSGPDSLLQHLIREFLTPAGLADLRVNFFNPNLISDHPKQLGMKIVNLKIQLSIPGDSAAQTTQNFAHIVQQTEKCVSSVGDLLHRENPAGFARTKLPA